MSTTTPDWSGLVYTLLLLVSAGLVVLIALLLYVLWRVRRINLPSGTSFMDALRATPLSVVLLLDALDWSLDVFSTPFTWVILSRLGLAPLRGVAIVKDLIPFTNFVPAMTIAWLGVRALDFVRPNDAPPRAVVGAPPPLLPPPEKKR